MLYRAASTVGTCPAAEYSRIAASAVTSAAVQCRAVAIRNRSAGSAWNSPGRRALSDAIAGPIGHRSIPGEPSALSIQTPTSIASRNRPLATRSATSQGVMAEMPTRPARRSSSILALAPKCLLNKVVVQDDVRTHLQARRCIARCIVLPLGRPRPTSLIGRNGSPTNLLTTIGELGNNMFADASRNHRLRSSSKPVCSFSSSYIREAVRPILARCRRRQGFAIGDAYLYGFLNDLA